MEKYVSKAAAARGVELVRHLGKGREIAIEDSDAAALLQSSGLECVNLNEARAPAALFAGDALDDAEHFQILTEAAKRLSCPILVIEGNSGYSRLALSALAGSQNYRPMYEALGCPGYTERSLDARFQAAGFVCVGEADVEESVAEGTEKNAFEADGAQLCRTLRSLTEETCGTGKKTWLVRLYGLKPESPAVPRQENVFLTVLMRTQGKRVQAIREALLCLNGQKDMDFEIILIGHRVERENQKNIDRILSECPPEISERISYYALNEGGRAAPINMGFRLARGMYMAIFDDDDILTADWVAAFRRAHEQAPGAILHSYAVGQDWRLVTPRDKAGLRAESGFDTTYCKSFDWERQTHTNYCPLMTLAFPVYLYREMKLQFDETLEVMEDWDFLLRAAAFCGVQDEAAVTAIYRKWKNAENSHVLHDQNYWTNNYKQITDRHKDLQILLPRRAADSLRAGYQAELDKQYLLDLIKTKERAFADRERLLNIAIKEGNASKVQGLLETRLMNEKLFCDDGRGWTEDNAIAVNTGALMGRFEFSYEHLSSMQTRRYMRWDPCMDGNLMIKGFYGSVTDRSGNQYFFQPKDITSNGIFSGGNIFFTQTDPQIYLRLPKDFVPEYLMIGGEALTSVPVEQMFQTKILWVLVWNAIKKLMDRIRFKINCVMG